MEKCIIIRANTFLGHICETSSIVSNLTDYLGSLYVFFSGNTKRYAHLYNLLSISRRKSTSS